MAIKYTHLLQLISIFDCI